MIEHRLKSTREYAELTIYWLHQIYGTVSAKFYNEVLNGDVGRSFESGCCTCGLLDLGRVQYHIGVGWILASARFEFVTS